jgi:Domain of unknown function (DUF4296)
MRIALPVLLALLLLTACGGKNKVPRDILPHDKMEAVLWDMFQADEFLREYMLNKDSALNDTTESIRMYERIFRLNKTSREEFSRSFHFYTAHTSLLKEILDSLNVKGQKVSEEVARPKPVIDTSAIRKVRLPLRKEL